MDALIKVEGLKKMYENFTLDIPKFEVGKGEIIGLIGENGAGKTTFLDILLNRRLPDGGTVAFYGNKKADEKDRERIGFVVDGGYLDGSLCAKQIDKIMKRVYISWDSDERYIAGGGMILLGITLIVFSFCIPEIYQKYGYVKTKKIGKFLGLLTEIFGIIILFWG